MRYNSPKRLGIHVINKRLEIAAITLHTRSELGFSTSSRDKTGIHSMDVLQNKEARNVAGATKSFLR